MSRVRVIAIAGLLLLGAGCWSKPVSTPAPAPLPLPPTQECPDVCAAICAGKPEPVVPPGCAMPMCACDPIQKQER